MYSVLADSSSPARAKRSPGFRTTAGPVYRRSLHASSALRNVPGDMVTTLKEKAKMYSYAVFDIGPTPPAPSLGSVRARDEEKTREKSD